MHRNNSIELLRCLLMFLIVFGHSCYYGVLPWTKCYWLVALILASAVITFGAGVVVDLLRRSMLRPFANQFDIMLKRIDTRLS